MIELCLVVYQRVHRIPELLNQLHNQTCQDFKINIWNNSEKHLTIKGDFPNKRITTINSETNVGSQARFKLAKTTTGNPIIFIDDDLILNPDFIEYNYNQYLKFGPSCILGWFTRTFTSENYWNCNSSSPYGQEVDYIGTAGLVMNRELIDHEALLQNIPKKYEKVEDLYLSYLARTKYKMNLISVNPYCSLVVDGKDQCSELITYKQNAFLSLRQKGWKLLKDEN